MQMSTESLPKTAAPTVRYTLDASHSNVTFSVRHMMITNVRGEFQKIEGSVQYNADHPDSTQMSGTVDATSVSTRDEKRDAHLRSPDFFDTEKSPKITFASTGARRHGNALEVSGNLTIRDITRNVTFTVTDITPEHTDPWGQRRIGASATTKIKRSDFGITWNAALEAGGVLVGDEVTLTIEASLIRQA